MDKEILVVIGKLYLDIYTLSNLTENLKARITELENQLAASASKDEIKQI